jgi:hypothetical protein
MVIINVLVKEKMGFVKNEIRRTHPLPLPGGDFSHQPSAFEPLRLYAFFHGSSKS